MADLSKQALKVANNTNFPNNNTGYITPALLREFNTDMIDSTVNQTQYNTNSGSWNASITNINAFTASASGLSTGSLLITASAASNIITFTKGDSSQFSVTVADTTNLTPLNQFTASAQISLNNLNIWTSSYQPVVVNLQASQSINETKFSTIGSQSGSWITESETGSFAVTNATNTFTTTNTFTSISASSYVSASTFVGDGSKLTNLPGQTPLTSLNAFTASQLTINSSLIASTASLNTYTASQDNKNLGVGASTSSLNAYTASNDTKWTTLQSLTSSNSSSVNQLNAFTSSQATKNTTLASVTSSLITSASSALYTASFDNGTRNLTFTKGDTTQFSLNIPDISGSNTPGVVSSSAQILAYNIFATTGSNTFTGSQIITGSVTATGFSGSIASTNGVVSGSSQVVGILSSLNTYTSSQDTKNGAVGASTASLNTFSSSVLYSILWLNQTTQSMGYATQSLNTFTASAQISLNNLNSATASLFTSTSLSLVTASVSLNTITFTKGDKTTFAITVNTGSAGGATDITALNTFTASQDTKNLAVGYSTSSLNAYTASNDTKWSTLSTQTASNSSSLNQLNAFTQSQATQNTTLGTYTASVDTKFTAVGASTSSLNTFTSSANTQLSNLSLSSSRMLTTASVNLNTITFTKGDATTFNITVNTGSGGGTADLTSLNAFTASQETKNSTLSNVTSSLNSATASLFTSASNALVTASISGQLLTFNKGNNSQFTLTIPTGSGTYVTGSFGSFHDETTQSGSANTPNIVKFSNTDLSQDVFLSGSSALKVGSAGVYNLQFSLQVKRISGSGTDAIDIWFRKNGSDIDWSNTTIGLDGGVEATRIVPAWNFMESMEIGDYLEILWQSTDDNIQLISVPASGSLPAIPSVIATMQRVDVGGGSNMVTTSSFNSYTSSTNSRLTNIESATASLFTSTSLSLTTASFSGNTLTFTKGNGTTFGVVIPDVSGSTINTGSFVTTSSFNTYTASVPALTSLNSFTQSILGTNAWTASINTKFATIGSQSGSWGAGGSTNTGSLLLTASVSATPNTITFTKGDLSTFDVTLNITSSATASFNTSSFATTGSNQFNGNQTITGSLNVKTITTLDPAGNTPATPNESTGTLLIFNYNEFNGGINPNVSYIANDNGVGWVMSGSGITDGTVTSAQYGANGVEVNITSGNVVSGSSYIGTGPYYPTLVISGAVYSNSGFNSPGGFIVRNENGTGNPYGGIGIQVDTTTDPTNVFSTVFVSGQTSEASIQYGLSSYTNEYPGETVPTIYAGGYYNGSDTTMTFYSSSIQMWHPTEFKVTPSFKEGAIFTGSVTINKNPNISQRALTLTGSLTVSGAVSIQGETSFVNKNGATTNVILGANAMNSISGNVQNSIAIGDSAMRYSSGSSENTAIGYFALAYAIGTNNVALGSNALANNTTGNQNIGIGTGASNRNLTGGQNTTIGVSSGFYNITGSKNTYIGYQAGQQISGSNNLILGSYAGTANQTLNNNIILSDGQGNVKAQYSGSAWSFQDEIRLNVGTDKPANVVSVAGGGTTITNSLAKTNSIILVTSQDLGGGDEYPAVISSKSNGSFVISHNFGGNIDVAYLIINPTT